MVVAYPNLRAEMARRGIKVNDIAKMIGVTRVSASNKLNGRTAIFVSEAIKIAESIETDLSVEVLFEKG